VVVAAPRIDARLVAALDRLDDPRLPIAETHRSLGAVADRLGLPRPSYEQSRVLLHELRRHRAEPLTAELRVRLAIRVAPAPVFRAVAPAIVAATRVCNSLLQGPRLASGRRQRVTRPLSGRG